MKRRQNLHKEIENKKKITANGDILRHDNMTKRVIVG